MVKQRDFYSLSEDVNIIVLFVIEQGVISNTVFVLRSMLTAPLMTIKMELVDYK